MLQLSAFLDLALHLVELKGSALVGSILREALCKECRAEARMKTENREKEDAGLMGAWSHAQYAGERERERVREKTENFYSKL